MRLQVESLRILKIKGRQKHASSAPVDCLIGLTLHQLETLRQLENRARQTIKRPLDSISDPQNRHKLNQSFVVPSHKAS
jgi:hypothetical protein